MKAIEKDPDRRYQTAGQWPTICVDTSTGMRLGQGESGRLAKLRNGLVETRGLRRLFQQSFWLAALRLVSFGVTPKQNGSGSSMTFETESTHLFFERTF